MQNNTVLGYTLSECLRCFLQVLTHKALVVSGEIWRSVPVLICNHPTSHPGRVLFFVEPTWASSLSFDFQIWYPNHWVYPWCSSVKGRFEHVNEWFSVHCDEICESATNGLGRELFTLWLTVIWRDCSFLVNILAIAVQWFDCEPASLVFFSSGTPPPTLSHWKCFKTASNTVKQKKNMTGKQDKSVLFKKH